MKMALIGANQDLGVKVDGAHLGPPILSDYFKINNRYNLEFYKVDKDNVSKEIERKNRKKNLKGVNNFNEKLYKTVFDLKNKNVLPITLGGDHTVAIASALASIKKEENLGIIWIDAHGDYNTFETTITGNLHGLPLAAINGLCPDLTKFHNGNYYSHKKTIIVGGRDIDDWEMPNLLKDKIKIFTTNDIHKYGVEKVMEEAFRLASNDTNGVHVSYDLDVIDPIVAPGVSVPAISGISKDEALEIKDEIIKHKYMIKSLDVVEYNPLFDKNDKTKNIAIDILEDIIKKCSL